MTEREALKLALEALESCDAAHITDGGRQWYDEKLVDKAITAIKESLAKLEQEPVAWTLLLVGEHHGIIGKAGDAFASAPEHYRRVDVYATPPQRKPLTDEEILLISADCASSHQHTDIHFARAIEAKLRRRTHN